MEKPILMKIIRVSKFKNQKEAAAAAGISRPWYALIESGSLKPTEDVCRKLENAFSLPTASLLKEIDIEKLIIASV